MSEKNTKDEEKNEKDDANDEDEDSGGLDDDEIEDSLILVSGDKTDKKEFKVSRKAALMSKLVENVLEGG